MSWITVLWMLMSMPAMPIYKEFHFENDFCIWRPLTAFGVHLEQPFSLLLLHNGPTVHPEMVSVRKVYILVNLWGPNWEPNSAQPIIDSDVHGLASGQKPSQARPKKPGQSQAK
jgi:hypothetical protein